MRYNNTVVEHARSTDMLAFFSRYMSFSFNIKGNEYRCNEHPSLSVKNDRLTWYWHSRSIGGRGALDFLMKTQGMGFREAMAKLVGTEPSPLPSHIESPSARPLILPERADFLYNRLYAYLNQTRGIDGKIIITLIQDKRLYQDKKGNIVFVGYDENNVPRFASLRGTYTDNPFRADSTGSDKRYGFNMDNVDNMARSNLYIFESPIDCMSHATLVNLKTGDKNAWRNDKRLSLGGTSSLALCKYLELNDSVSELIFCLDNDPAGREGTASLAREFGRKDYRTQIALPMGKDFNDDLLTARSKLIGHNRYHDVTI